MAAVWYRVRDLDAARRFYVETLGFEVTAFDDDEGWVNLRHGEMEIALMRGEPVEDGGVAHVDVEDVKAEAERLREAGVEHPMVSGSGPTVFGVSDDPDALARLRGAYPRAVAA